MTEYLDWMLEREQFNFNNYELPEDIPVRVSLLDLHPICRGAFALLQIRLLDGYRTGGIKTRFAMFQGYRSPEDQDKLYAQGRTKPGNKVTNAMAWTSSHQYGLAVDFVPHEPGRGWHWDESADWAGLRAAAELRGLKNSLAWDRPHVWHPAHDTLVRRVRQTG